MPAPLGPFVGIALGALLALLTKDPEQGDLFFTRRARVVALFALLVFAPACGYFLAFAPDWAWLYMVDAARVPSALALLLALVDALAVLLGWTIAQRGIRADGPRAAAIVVALPTLIALVTAAVYAREIRTEATFKQFHVGFGTEPTFAGALGLAVLWMNAMIAAGVVVTARILAAPPRTDEESEKKSGIVAEVALPPRRIDARLASPRGKDREAKPRYLGKGR